VDQSGRDAKQGIVYTPIFAGAHKVDFSSHAPLSEDARALAQEEVDRLYAMFVQAVADGRGIDPQAVRDTEAGLLNPQAAQDVGFIDGVRSFDQALAALAAEARQQRYRGMRAAAVAVLADDFERVENRTAIAQESSDFHPLSPEGEQEPIEMATETKPAITADDLAQATPDEPGTTEGHLARLDALIEEATAEFLGWLDGRDRRAAAHALIERADREREAELAELWRRLPGLDADERATIEGMSRHLAKRLLREPLERLGTDADGRHERAVRELWAL